MSLAPAARELSAALAGLRWPEQVTHVYDPTDYAREVHEDYLARYAGGPRRVLFLGMNPGPWGMAQTGVPFGAVPWAKKLRVTGHVGRPAVEHPKRPVQGFDCARVEVSGDRLWGLLDERYGLQDRFKDEATVLNYCPLLFVGGAGGRCVNITPDKLGGAGSRLQARCDGYLAAALELVAPEIAIGVGAWATKRLAHVAGAAVRVGRMLHPSPASPAANRGFSQHATSQLDELAA